MNKNINKSIILLICLVVSACTVIQSHPENNPVRLVQKNELNIVAADNKADCRYLGEIIGSEGHWYTYLFISNTNLTQGAINDLYNKANEVGANVVFISDDINFTTSVTFYGQSYFCDYGDESR